MKIGVAKDGINISQHFGHCEGFDVFEVEGGKITGKNFIQSPGHQPGFLPPFLAQKGVNVVIAGGMGATAQQLFQQHGITVVVGVQGTIDDAVKSFLNGTLVSTGSVCEEHQHEGHCND